jgi:hypothetical protein
VKHLFKWGAIHKVGNGARTQFWNDVWLTSSPLRISFSRLFDICDDPNVLVAYCVARGWMLGFRRMMGPEVHAEWLEIQGLLRQVVISDE